MPNNNRQMDLPRAVLRLVDLALEEDLGPGDVTTDAIFSPDQAGAAVIVAKQDLVAAGMDLARLVFHLLDQGLVFTPLCEDGQEASAGSEMARISGRVRPILYGERTALNFLQRLSGIATNTRDFVRAAGKGKARLVDTRKTTPGWRVLEKYAVRMGGAFNHRMGLYDGVLIKDNHIAAAGSIQKAVEKARLHAHHLLAVEVEVDDLSQLEQALKAGADVVMLDNMDNETIARAVEINEGRALLEVSGGVTADRLPSLAASGVNLISVGALTHSARAVDISLNWETD